MSKLDKDQVIANFTAAYTAANGKAPEIEAKGGWYSVDGGKNIRLAQLDEMTGSLSSGGNTAAEPKKAAKASTTKPTAAAKKPAKAAAKPAAKKAKPASGGFSVKAFWREQINSTNPGSKQPR